MADQTPQKQPQASPDLTQELDKNALSPQVVSVESGPEALQPPTVDDISEGDIQEALAAADQTEEPQLHAAPQNLQVEPTTNPFLERPRFWKRKKFWISTIFLLILLLALAWLIRPSRLFMVNLLGLRGSLNIATATLAAEGQQSAVLKKVKIELNGTQWETDDNGRLNAQLLYGTYNIVAKKAGYQDATHSVMVDFDPFFYLLGGRQADEQARNVQLQLKPTGIALSFKVVDWLTGSPLTAGAFSAAEIVAKPNDQGVVNITLPATEEKTVKIKAVFGGKFTDKEFDLPLDGSQATVSFVPEGKTYYLTNKNGLAVLGSNLDGSSVAEIVPPSANETAAVNIAISPSGKFGVLASTRDARRDTQGTLLQQLYIVDLSNKKLTAVDQGLWFSFADWSADTLVYTVGERKTGASQVTQRLVSLDATNGKRTDISAARTFDAVRVAVGSVVYQANLAISDPASVNNPELRVTPIKGGTEKKLGAKVQSISQADTDRFVFQLGDGTWQEYNLNTSQAKTASAPTSTARAMLATASADGQNRLIIDRIDGKPSLIVKNAGTGQEKQIFSAAGIRGPLRIIDDTIVFRMGEGAQVADYVVSIRGGTPKKIADVTLSAAPFTPPANYFSFF
ncbi:MAG TPA: hypothetical protein VFO38_04170 [Candidatus Saccharimonadales bacterium]|nr:hypothetical protein [Candidatus Saccharimonadales bacterium]